MSVRFKPFHLSSRPSRYARHTPNRPPPVLLEPHRDQVQTLTDQYNNYNRIGVISTFDRELGQVVPWTHRSVTSSTLQIHLTPCKPCYECLTTDNSCRQW